MKQRPKVKAPPIKNKPIKLEDLMPEAAAITIKGKLYHLRKVNLLDEAWLAKYYPNAQELFNKEDFNFMLTLAFRLMNEKDQADFEPYEKIEKNPLTYEDEAKFLSPAEVMMEGISGINEKVSIMTGLLQTIGISRPVFDAMIEEDAKKKGINLAK